MTARARIVARLYASPEPLPLHRLDIPGVSESAAGARLRELTRDGITQAVKVPGKKFLAWRLTPADLTLPLVITAPSGRQMNDTQGATK